MTVTPRALLLALALTSTPLVAQPLAERVDVAARVARRAAVELGVHVVDLQSGREVYAFEADAPRILASNTKLFTTAAALDVLGPGHFFETPVLVRGLRSGNQLLGDLGVVGGGDPNISGRKFDGDPLAVFRRWARELKGKGIDRISGDLFLADGFFESLVVHPDWPRDQLSRWYEAPVGALSFSDNCFLLRVTPGPASGRPVTVEVVPDLGLVQVTNSATTTASTRNHLVRIGRDPGSWKVRLSGNVYVGSQPFEAWVSVPEPTVYFGAALRKALRDEGVVLDGRQVIVKRLPKGLWRQLTVHRSDLLTTVDVVNKRSQNFFAEAVLKLLGAVSCDDGSWEAGRRVVGDFLVRLGFPPSSYRFADGSGMSRNNRFTARQMTRLLAFMNAHPARIEFMASLPFGGDEEHRRWKDRLAKPPYRGNVLAKTGSLRAVSTLSGYARAGSGKLYAFSILCNRVRSDWDARRAQDGIVRELIDHG